MSAISQINIEDWSVTPTVVKTLQPVQNSPKAIWKGTDPAVPAIGQIQTEISVIEGKANDPLRRVQLMVTVPHLEAQSSSGSSAGYVAAPKIAHIGKVKIEFILNNRATPADNWTLQQFAYNFLNNPAVLDAVKFGIRPT